MRHVRIKIYPDTLDILDSIIDKMFVISSGPYPFCSYYSMFDFARCAFGGNEGRESDGMGQLTESLFLIDKEGIYI